MSDGDGPWNKGGKCNLLVQTNFSWRIIVRHDDTKNWVNFHSRQLKEVWQNNQSYIYAWTETDIFFLSNAVTSVSSSPATDTEFRELRKSLTQ